MKNFNQKYLVGVITLFSMMIITNTRYAFSSSGTVDYVLGKVIYSDNNLPVSQGNIRVLSNAASKSGLVIGTAVIQSNGEFSISNNIVASTDDIKIMAYPNDLTDGSEVPFEPNIIDMENALSNQESKYSIIIKVNRIQNSQDTEKEKYGGVNLKQNFPNPFNPSTSISFDLPNTSKVTLKIYNMRGETVATLIDNKTIAKGLNEVEFNAGNLTSGIYIYSLKAGSFVLNRKMILLK